MSTFRFNQMVHGCSLLLSTGLGCRLALCAHLLAPIAPHDCLPKPSSSSSSPSGAHFCSNSIWSTLYAIFLLFPIPFDSIFPIELQFPMNYKRIGIRIECLTFILKEVSRNNANGASINGNEIIKFIFDVMAYGLTDSWRCMDIIRCIDVTVKSRSTCQSVCVCVCARRIEIPSGALVSGHKGTCTAVNRIQCDIYRERESWETCSTLLDFKSFNYQCDCCCRWMLVSRAALRVSLAIEKTCNVCCYSFRSHLLPPRELLGLIVDEKSWVAGHGGRMWNQR